MLEDQDAPTLWDNVNLLLHSIIVKCGCAALELICGVVEIQVECEIGSLSSVGRFVAAIVVRCLVSVGQLMRLCIHAFEILASRILQKSHPVIQSRYLPGLFPLRRPNASHVSPVLQLVDIRNGVRDPCP
jgi:hypothetical protein